MSSAKAQTHNSLNERGRNGTLLNSKDLHILKRLLLQQNMSIIRAFEKSQQPVPFNQDKARASLCAKG